MEHRRWRPTIGGRRKKQLLFVCGCPRSGTTAMHRLLSGHPQACIGMERYATIFNTGQPLNTALFEKERFLTLQSGDTFYDKPRFEEYHDGFAEKFDACRYVGDKLPYLCRRWDDVFALRPKPIVVFMVRNVFDVAASYNYRARDLADPWPPKKNAILAIREWNAALRLADDAIASGHASQLLFVEYEGFFQRQQRMRGLLSHLGLSTAARDTDYLSQIAAGAVRVYQNRDKIRELTEPQKRQLLLTAQVSRYRRLLPRITGWMSADFDGGTRETAGSSKAA